MRTLPVIALNVGWAMRTLPVIAIVISEVKK